ncbi:hypothetical protein V8E55_008703 [Tylopilus felleus]
MPFKRSFVRFLRIEHALEARSRNKKTFGSPKMRREIVASPLSKTSTGVSVENPIPHCIRLPAQPSIPERASDTPTPRPRRSNTRQHYRQLSQASLRADHPPVHLASTLRVHRLPTSVYATSHCNMSTPPDKPRHRPSTTVNLSTPTLSPTLDHPHSRTSYSPSDSPTSSSSMLASFFAIFPV